MSVAICNTPAALFHFENAPVPAHTAHKAIDTWLVQSKISSPPPPYIHPMVKRSSSQMSLKSLEMCTESLGSETGSDDFYDDDWFSSPTNTMKGKQVSGDQVGNVNGRKELLSSVNYCSISRKSAPRTFPPPLPSISRRDGPCIHMRPHRRDGRLVVEAVAVPSQNYLHARRQDGRLLLSFIETAPISEVNEPAEVLDENDVYYDEEVEIEDEDEEEEEEEVEVVDRGTIVEVKVSTQPQPQSGAMKVLRSSLVINKFVGGNQDRWVGARQEDDKQSRKTPATAAAAAVAASSVSAASEEVGDGMMHAMDSKVLFTSKRRGREELLHHMRRCSELRRPLFFWEPCCIATSS